MNRIRLAIALASILLLPACFTSNYPIVPQNQSFVPASGGNFCRFTYDNDRSEWARDCSRVTFSLNSDNSYSYTTSDGSGYRVRIYNVALTTGAFSGYYPAEACTDASCDIIAVRVFGPNEFHVVTPYCESEKQNCTVGTISQAIREFEVTNRIYDRTKFERIG